MERWPADWLTGLLAENDADTNICVEAVRGWGHIRAEWDDTTGRQERNSIKKDVEEPGAGENGGNEMKSDFSIGRPLGKLCSFFHFPVCCAM